MKFARFHHQPPVPHRYTFNVDVQRKTRTEPNQNAPPMIGGAFAHYV
jgi:hypothetical protein